MAEVYDDEMEDVADGTAWQPEMVVGFEPFPIDLLPGVVSAFIREAALATHCDPAAVALPAITTISAAIGNARRLRLKKRWLEPSVIWGAIVGKSGSRKSPANELTLGYLEQWEAEQEKWYGADMAEYERHDHAFQVVFAKWKKAAQGEPPEKPHKPVLKRIIVHDATVEALGQRFANNPRGLLLNRDELSGFFGGMDCYKSSAGHADESCYLAMHGARPLHIDRVSRDGVRVKNAALSICGAITQEVLALQLTPIRFASGLAARFLFVMPPAKLVKWSDADISDLTDDAFGQMIQKLLSLETDSDGAPILMRLSGEARERFIAFHDELEISIFESDNGRLSAAWSKQVGYSARLALIITLIRWADSFDDVPPEAVDGDSMRRAIELTRWFNRETDRVYGCLWESEERRHLDDLVNILKHHSGAATIRELMKGPGRRQWKNKDECDADFTKLITAKLARRRMVGKRAEVVLCEVGDRGTGDTSS